MILVNETKGEDSNDTAADNDNDDNGNEELEEMKEEKPALDKSSSDKPDTERCKNDPNFAVVCSFLDQFGETLGLPCPSILDLETMLEQPGQANIDLINFQIKLLRKLKKTVSFDKWERVLTRFTFTYSSEDGWELDRFGYKRAKLALRIRIIKALCEAQFDLNARFKLNINKLDSGTLRLQPIGKDKLGNCYWFQVDPEANVRVYREDLDDETWELVASNRDELAALVELLTDKETFARTVSQEEMEEEDSMQGLEDIIRDTGPVDSNLTSANASKYNSEDEDTRGSFASHGTSTPERGVNPRPGVQTMDPSVSGKLGGPAEKFIPWKKRGLSESPVDFASQQDGQWDGPEVKRQRKEEEEVGEEEEMVGFVAGRGSGAESDLGNPIVGEEVSEEMILVVGRGSGAENLARSTRRAAANGVAIAAAARNGANGDASDSEEEESDVENSEDEDVLPPAKRGRGGGRGVAGARGGRGRGRGRAKPPKSEEDESEEEEEVRRTPAKKTKPASSEEDESGEEEEEEKPEANSDEDESEDEDATNGKNGKNGGDGSDGDGSEEEAPKPAAKAGRGRGRGRGGSKAQEPAEPRPGRGGSSRVQILKLKEEERKKKEAEEKVRLFELAKKKVRLFEL